MIQKQITNDYFSPNISNHTESATRVVKQDGVHLLGYANDDHYRTLQSHSARRQQEQEDGDGGGKCSNSRKREYCVYVFKLRDSNTFISKNNDKIMTDDTSIIML